MVADHITRMEKLDSSYRPVYETALKYASATAFLGEYFADVNEHTSIGYSPFCIQAPRKRFVVYFLERVYPSW